MAKNVKAVGRGLCGHIMSCSNGNEYCVLNPHSDNIGHTSLVSPHTTADNVLKGLEYIQDQYGDAHVCPPILIVNEEFYRTILQLITSGGESMRRQYADAVILVAQRIKEQEPIPGATAWIGDGA